MATMWTNVTLNATVRDGEDPEETRDRVELALQQMIADGILTSFDVEDWDVEP